MFMPVLHFSKSYEGLFKKINNDYTPPMLLHILLILYLRITVEELVLETIELFTNYTSLSFLNRPRIYFLFPGILSRIVIFFKLRTTDFTRILFRKYNIFSNDMLIPNFI